MWAVSNVTLLESGRMFLNKRVNLRRLQCVHELVYLRQCFASPARCSKRAPRASYFIIFALICSVKITDSVVSFRGFSHVNVCLSVWLLAAVMESVVTLFFKYMSCCEGRETTWEAFTWQYCSGGNNNFPFIPESVFMCCSYMLIVGLCFVCEGFIIVIIFFNLYIKPSQPRIINQQLTV